MSVSPANPWAGADEAVKETGFSDPFPSAPRGTLVGMGSDDVSLRDAWLGIARAAADHRRITSAGDEMFYGDLTLRDTDDAHAWTELLRALRSALDAATGQEEIVDALRSADPRLDVGEADELIEWARTRDERLRELNARLLRGLFGKD